MANLPARWAPPSPRNVKLAPIASSTTQVSTVSTCEIVAPAFPSATAGSRRAKLLAAAAERQLTVQARILADRGRRQEMISREIQSFEVRVELERIAAQCAQKMHEVDREAEARTKEVQRQVRSLEVQRLQGFQDARRSVNEVEAKIEEGRSSAETELEAISQRLQQVQEQTQERIRHIFAQWAAGQTVTEVEVRHYEQRSQEAVQAMQETVRRRLRETAELNKQLQQEAVQEVLEHKRIAFEVVDATQPAVEAARQADDAATAALFEEYRRLRPELHAIEEAADAEIKAALDERDAREAAAKRESEERQAAARAATHAAKAEELRLINEASALRARLREACYRLRLANKHDFAQAIAAGQYDLSPAAASDAAETSVPG